MTMNVSINENINKNQGRTMSEKKRPCTPE